MQIRGLAATSGVCAVFLGNEEKVFVIYVEQSVGLAITLFMQGTKKERPLTHDLLANILRAFEAKIERVIVTEQIIGVAPLRSMSPGRGLKLCANTRLTIGVVPPAK